VLINLLNKVRYSRITSVSVTAETTLITENVASVAVLVTTVTGESGSGRTLQADIIIRRSIGVWCSIVFAKCKCNCVCD